MFGCGYCVFVRARRFYLGVQLGLGGSLEACVRPQSSCQEAGISLQRLLAVDRIFLTLESYSVGM